MAGQGKRGEGRGEWVSFLLPTDEQVVNDEGEHRRTPLFIAFFQGPVAGTTEHYIWTVH